MSNATFAHGLHRARVCLIPHADNGHKPLVLRHKPLAAISILLIVSKILAIAILALTPTEAELSTITANRIIQLTNAERTKIGLGALTINPKLTEAAQLKAADMLKNQYFAHISPSGVTPWHWMEQADYTYEVAGENLAIDFSSAEDVVSAWLASPKHKENMLRPDYAETGVAVASGTFKGSTSIIVVHMFGKPFPAVLEPTPQPAKQQETAPAVTPIPATPEPTIIPTQAPEDLLSKAQAKAFVPVATPSPVGVPASTAEVLPAVSSIVLSPAFDTEEFAVQSNNTTSTWQLFSAHSSIAINTDVVLAVPLFTIHPTTQSSSIFAATVSRLNRDFTGTILITIATLLAIAIFVRIRVQHPFMIAHASIVIVLAFVLLLA